MKTAVLILLAAEARYHAQGIKAGDTLSSHHVSSCDVTRAVGM